MSADKEPTDRWWVIAESELLRSLREAFDGAPPDLVLLELTANSERGEDAES